VTFVVAEPDLHRPAIGRLPAAREPAMSVGLARFLDAQQFLLRYQEDSRQILARHTVCRSRKQRVLRQNAIEGIGP
jgi:hypothetical protein